MSSSDVTTNQTVGSDQKSDLTQNKPQDQSGSGTDDPKQINGKNVVGKPPLLFFSSTRGHRRSNRRALALSLSLSQHRHQTSVFFSS